VARPIKRLHGESDVVKDLRRRPPSTTIGVRDRERAEITLPTASVLKLSRSG